MEVGNSLASIYFLILYASRKVREDRDKKSFHNGGPQSVIVCFDKGVTSHLFKKNLSS
jgi:hypothetical protein